MAKKIVLGSLLVLVILMASLYILMPGKVRIDFEETRTIFKVYEDDKFVVSGIEYVRIFDGTKLMRAKNRTINYTLLEGKAMAERVSMFKDEIVIDEKYEFNNNVTSVENVPLAHNICFANASGKIFEYMIDKVTYDGETKDITSPFAFGRNMKLVFQDGWYRAKVHNYKTVSDKIKIRYRVEKDYQCFNVRLFDPIPLNDSNINDLRNNDSITIKGDLTKTYKSSTKEILIVDKNSNVVVKMRLTSPYLVSGLTEGNDTKVAEFYLDDWMFNKTNIMDSIDFYDVKDNYEPVDKTFRFKYGIDYIECNNATKQECDISTNWTVFETLQELPHKNITISLWANTKIGEKVEWVPTIEGFETLQWAAWDVGSGTKFEFDAIYSADKSLVRMNATHYITVYRGTTYATAVVLIVDPVAYTITKGTNYDYDTSNGATPSIIQVDLTHYLVTFTGTDGDGYAAVLTVNPADLTLSIGTKHEFDIANGAWNKLAQINTSHYINTYAGNANVGTAVVLIVDTVAWTVTSGTKHVFDATIAFWNSLVQIDETHYLNTHYCGDGDHGCAVALIVDLSDLTITDGGKLTFETSLGADHSVTQIDTEHYINTYRGSGEDGFAIVLTVNTGDWSFTG